MRIIDQYRAFHFRSAVAAVPYFNNKTVMARASFRVNIGKGSPEDIFEELTNITVREHLTPDAFGDETLSDILRRNNIGIDCSGFAYYVLNGESLSRNKGQIDKHIHFTNCKGIIGKIRCSIRPAENCDVATFANDKNSHKIAMNEAAPGDIITMIGGDSASGIRNGDRDHILVIHQVEYQNFKAVKLHYSNAVTYPEDGVNSGIKQGIIEISDPSKTISEQLWSENGKQGQENRMYVRAQRSLTELRRLNWF